MVRRLPATTLARYKNYKKESPKQENIETLKQGIFENVLTLRGAKEGTCLSIICKKLILYVQAVDRGVVMMINGRGEYRLTDTVEPVDMTISQA